MKFLRVLGNLFLLPGTIAMGLFNLSVENDGGIFRSLINMLFWGALGAIIMAKLNFS